MLITRSFPDARIKHRVDDIETMQSMARYALGLVVLPCYMADPDPHLARFIPEPMVEDTPDLWVLFHPDVRHVARVRLFTQFIAGKIDADRDLFEGRRPRPVAPDVRLSSHTVRYTQSWPPVRDMR